MQSKSIKGRICYKDGCYSCGEDRGYVPKARLGKRCKSCAVHVSKAGKPSPLKGRKTGKPAYNRGEYFNNSEKKLLKNRMSRRLRHALSGRQLSKKWLHIFDILGYSVNDLMQHLENQFKDGMSWSNCHMWHIDHIIPESSFNYSSFHDKEFKECWGLKNLQPLWAEDNRKKGCKMGVCHSNSCK